MKAKITSFIIIFCVLFGFYIYFFSFIEIENHELGIVKDKNSQEIVYIFHKDMNFVWQGSIPWLFSVYKISQKQSIIDTIKINIPSLKDLKGEYYLINVPVKLVYVINSDEFSSNELLKNSVTGVNELPVSDG